MCCRDFKGIILTLLWESNEHLLNVIEVRATTHRPLPVPWPAVGHTSAAVSASYVLLMALWVKLRKGDSSSHDHGYPASVTSCGVFLEIKPHSFIYPFIEPLDISWTLCVRYWVGQEEQALSLSLGGQHPTDGQQT